MFPKVSVCCTAFRPGGIDILLEGMTAQTYKDFEVVLVDRRYELRHDRVMQMAKDRRVNLIHVPEHRRNSPWISFASAWNTAFAVARGEYVLMLADWMYAPPGWIERHLELGTSTNGYILGPYRFLAMPKLKLKQPFDFMAVQEKWQRELECTTTSPVFDGDILDEIDVFENGQFDGSWVPLLERSDNQEDLRLKRNPGRMRGVDEGWLHIKNDSCFRSSLTEINGLEERLERGRGPLDIDLQIRLTVARIETWWDPDCFVYYIDPHYLIPTLPFGATHKRVAGRWSWDDGLDYVTKRKVEISFGGSNRAKNNYDINELAKRLESWRNPTTKIVINDVDDLTYWGCDMMPDTP